MLQSVIATVNRLGIESLRFEEEATRVVHYCSDSRYCVWAVVDSEDLRDVQQALLASEPAAAYYLLNDRAVSFGAL
jgi:hypothetical protein